MIIAYVIYNIILIYIMLYLIFLILACNYSGYHRVNIIPDCICENNYYED